MIQKYVRTTIGCAISWIYINSCEALTECQWMHHLYNQALTKIKE